MHFSYLKTSDDASNIGGGSRTGRGRGTSSSPTETAKQVTFSLFQYTLNRFMPTFHIGYLLMHFHSIFFEVMVPLMLEEEDHQLGGEGVEAEEDHQLGGGGVEAEVEVLQGLLLCLMCRNDHCLGYVITSH